MIGELTQNFEIIKLDLIGFWRLLVKLMLEFHCKNLVK